jgi:hypothetical protein
MEPCCCEKILIIHTPTANQLAQMISPKFCLECPLVILLISSPFRYEVDHTISYTILFYNILYFNHNEYKMVWTTKIQYIIISVMLKI